MKTQCAEERLSGQGSGAVCLVVGECDCGMPAQLRRLGLVEGETVRVVRAGECMVIECGGCRVALRREVAHLVKVVVVEEGGAQGTGDFGRSAVAAA